MNAAGFADYEIRNGNGSAVIPFNTGSADVNGCYWYMDGELGGWDSPDMRVTMLPRQGADPGADGEYPADLHYRGRTLTAKLIAACPTEAARQQAWYLINQALDLTNNSGLFKVNEEVPKQMVIQRAGNTGQGKLALKNLGFAAPSSITPDFFLPDTDPNGQMYLLQADVEMYAPDPRKYPQTAVAATMAASEILISNAGNTDTQNMVLVINAGISGMHITVDITIIGVGTMVLTVPTLPSGAPPAGNFPAILHVDFYNKTIKAGSGDNYYYLRDLRYPWLAVPPGDFILELTGGLGDPDGSILTYNSAWI